MESKSFEEKFSIFFNQFDNDTEIEFLFNFLEIVIIQYKADPRKVCGYFNIFVYFKKEIILLIISRLFKKRSHKSKTDCQNKCSK